MLISGRNWGFPGNVFNNLRLLRQSFVLEFLRELKVSAKIAVFLLGILATFIIASHEDVHV